MQQQLELHLHEQYALNNNSTLASMLTLFVSMLAVIYGYGYVFLNSVDRLEGVAMKVDGSYSWYALLFTNAAATLVLTAISYICVISGYKGRMEQFITHAIRKKYYPDVGFDAIFPNGYNPYKSGWFNAIQGPYDMFLVILSFLVAVMNIATIFRGCHTQVGAEVWWCILSLLFYALICFLAILKCYNKFMIRKAEYEIKEKIQKNLTLKSKILAMLKMKLFEIRTSLVVRHLFLVFLGLMCYAGAMAEDVVYSKVVIVDDVRYGLLPGGGPNGENVAHAIGFVSPSSEYYIGGAFEYDGVWYSVTKIAKKAFYQKEDIKGVIIRKGVEIDTLAFAECPNLEYVRFFEGSYNIRYGAFSNCPKLKKIYDNWGIPGYTKLNLGYRAFDLCPNLQSLDSIVISKLEIASFEGCSSLEGVILETSIIPSWAFFGCKALKNITTAYRDYKGNLHETTIKKVGYYAFRGCSNLESFNANLETLSGEAFYGCENLRSVHLGDNIRSIEAFAFSGCKALKGISLGDSIRYIDWYAFRETGLTEIKIPYYAKIGGHAFQNCKNLKEVSFTAPRTFEVYVPTQLGEYVFSGCSSLEKFSHQCAAYGSPYKWHRWVGPKAIPEGGFQNCTSLTSIPFLHSSYPSDLILDSIGAYAFQGCTGLESINFNCMWKVGPGAFYGCSSAREIYIGDHVQRINARTFEGCSSAETLTIGGEYVVSIGSNAFNGTAIKGDINIYAQRPPVCAPDAFGDVDKSACNLVIHVPTVYDVDGNNFEDSYEYQQLQEMYETSWERYLHYDEYKTQYIVSQLQRQDAYENECLENYKKADVWKDFYEDESIPTSIEKANMDGGAEPKPLEYYGTDGIRTTSPKKGVNIVRMSDGTVRKVIF